MELDAALSRPVAAVWNHSPNRWVLSFVQSAGEHLVSQVTQFGVRRH
jgi:hypothetical protein